MVEHRADSVQQYYGALDLSNDPVDFGAFPARCCCRFRLMPSQRSHHAYAGETSLARHVLQPAIAPASRPAILRYRVLSQAV
jgi:hypothetical protein